MKHHHNLIKDYLATLLSDVLEKELNLNKKNISIDIEQLLVPVPQISLGHIAFGVFPLAKIQKTSPAKIAQELACLVTKHLDQFDLIEKIVATGPYLNFSLKLEGFRELVLESIFDGTFFEKKLLDQPKSTMIEYSQPNTHKELHVGHMRNMSLGLALVKLHEYVQIPVVSTTFPGDVGTHVAKCLWYLKNHWKGDIPKEGKGAFLGKIYGLACKNFSDDAPITQILNELEQKNGEYYNLWIETREWSIDQMKNVYNWADVRFDRWYWESEVDSPSLARVKKYLEQGYLVESKGAIGADLSEDKLGFCLLIKSDGNGLYATKDIELAFEKAKEFQFEKNIYVVDKRQSHHFAQVFKVLEKVGYPKNIELVHLAYDFVELTTGAMSSREGNVVPILDLIKQMETHIKVHYLHRYNNIWNEEKIQQTASIVAKAAIKYGMICVDSQKKIVFSMEEWLKIEGNSGPYLLYIQARIASLLKKNADWKKFYPQNFSHEVENELTLKLSFFNDVALSACTQYRPSLLTNYLYELGRLYNSFYVECPIMKEASKDVANWRCTLSYLVMKTLQKGLEILGIEYPQEM